MCPRGNVPANLFIATHFDDAEFPGGLGRGGLGGSEHDGSSANQCSSTEGCEQNSHGNVLKNACFEFRTRSGAKRMGCASTFGRPQSDQSPAGPIWFTGPRKCFKAGNVIMKPAEPYPITL